MEIISSIETDKRKIYSVNMPNCGAIPNLPKDVIIEMPAAATANGIVPLQLNNFPDVLAQLLAKPIAINELTVEAALKGDVNLFVEAILMGGYMTDRSAVESMVHEMLKAQRQYLPQFQ